MENEKKKSNLGGIILFAILCIVAFAAGFYVSYNDVFGKKETKPEEVKKEEIKVLDTTDSIVDESVRKMVPGLYCGDLPFKFILKPSLKASDITNDEAMEFLASLRITGISPESKYEVKTNEKGENYIELSADEIAQKIKKILGKDYKFEHKSYGVGDEGTAFEYNKDTKTYKIVQIPFGCTTGPHAPSLERYTKAIIQGDKLIITYKVLFGSEVPDQPTTDHYAKYYKDIDQKTLVPEKDIQYKWVDEHLYMADESAVQNYNLGSTYKFTFKNEDNNYVFVSSKLVNE